MENPLAHIRNNGLSNRRVLSFTFLATTLTTSVTLTASTTVASSLPASYAAPCATSKEFAFAKNAQIQAHRDLIAKHYHTASRTFREAADRLDIYTTNRIFAAGRTIFDDTGTHLSLAKRREQAGDFKTSIYIGQKFLSETIKNCRNEPADIGETLKIKMGVR